MRSLARTLLVSLLIGSTAVASAQDEPDSFNTGSVYRVSMVRTDANSRQEYLEQLAKMYIPVMEAAKKEGLIKSYTILTGDFANEEDYNVLMLTEFANLAALDDTPEQEAKWKTVRESVRSKMGGKPASDAIRDSYHGMRTMVGNKIMRQEILKP